MEGFCRSCLIRYDDPGELLQYTEKNRRLFVYSTGIQVKRNDTITFQLCKDCFLSMKVACKFKKQCRASDKKFKSFLAMKDVGDGVDLCTFLKNSEDTTAFRLPLMCGSSTPGNQNKSRDDDNESTCTSIRNFMTDIWQGEEMPDTEARIIREVIEEEADVLDDSLDSHWLLDDPYIDTDFRLDFSISPFATPHSVNNDHSYTPKRFSEPKQQQEKIKKYFTSISPAEQDYLANDFTDIIKNNHSEKELCVFGTNEVITETAVDHFDVPMIDNENAVSHLDLPIIVNEKMIKTIDLPNIGNEISIDSLSFTVADDKKTVNNLSLPIIEEERSLNNLDLPSLPSIENDRSINNLDITIDSNDRLMKSLDLPSFDSEKSITNLDLPSLPSIDNERLNHDLELSKTDNDINDGRINTPNFYLPTDGTAYVTTSKEIERLVDSKKLEKIKPCPIDKNLAKALQNEDNKEFSLDDLLVSPQVFPGDSATSTPSITNILFGEKPINQNNSPKKLKYIEKMDESDIKIFEEFLQNNKKEFDKEDDVKKEEYIFKVPMDVDTSRETGGLKLSSEFDEGQFDLATFTCNICVKKFQSSKGLSYHFAVKHNIKIVKPKSKANNYKPQICNICGFEYKNRGNFHRHINRHKQKEEILQCDYCKLEFSSKPKLASHIRTHSQNRKNTVKKESGKYICTVCGATSTTIGNFRLHQRRHTNSYSYNCQECGKGFYRQSDFTVHMRIHTGEKPYSCKLCDKSFSRKDVLTNHIKHHINDKPYECEHCNTKFTKRCHLTVHMRDSMFCLKKRGIDVDENIIMQRKKRRSRKATEDDKPYECEHCNTKFTQKCHLTVHMRDSMLCLKKRGIDVDENIIMQRKKERSRKTTKDDKPYECEHCNTKFTKRCHLTVHMRDSMFCLKKRGIEVDENIIMQRKKKRSRKATEGNKIEMKKEEEVVKEEKPEIANNIEINQLPYLDTEMSN